MVTADNGHGARGTCTDVLETAETPSEEVLLSDRIRRLQEVARRIRLNALEMGEQQGQGYIAQALGVADILAVMYGDQLRLRPDDPEWAERDRFLLSIGHYAIALYAALAEVGYIDVEELKTYASDGSSLPMSAMASYTPGMEISGGSLGHGLAVGVGMAIGLRHKGNLARVYNMLSDGELDEGSTWEAALAGSHHELDNLTAIVDMNALQADGPTKDVLRTEPVEEKWRAFGWHAVRVNGNNVKALVTALDELRDHGGSPSVLICDTRIGHGVPFLESREKAHFMRVEPHEWGLARQHVKEVGA
jgi:transketolase